MERAPELPERFFWPLLRLWWQPCIPTAAGFCEPVLGCRDWLKPPEGQGARFLQDRDEAWLHRPAALAES